MLEKFTEDEFDKLVEQLNMLLGRGSELSPTVAKKDRIDLYGEEIKARETYYRRQYGHAYENAVELSGASMGKLLYSLFGHKSGVQLLKLADKLIAEEQEQISAKMW